MDSSTQRFLSVLVLLAACTDGKPVATRPAPAAPARSAASVAATAIASAEVRDPTPLAERLLHEASGQPEARAEVEHRLDTFRRAGVQFTRTRQALARPLGAQYCETAVTATGLGLSLCAFEGAAQAAQGRRRSHETFDVLIPGRMLLVDRSTMLTITLPASAEAKLEREHLRTRFMETPIPEHAAL